MSRWLLTAVVGSCVACGQQSPSKSGADSARTSGASAPTAAPTAQTPGYAKAPCPATGRWAVCTFEQRVRRAGLVARKIEGNPPARAAFSVKPVVYALGRDSRLELFLYNGAAELARDVAKMDTARVAPPGRSESWTVPPTFIRSANLAVVLLSRDAREADRLFLALTAGPPGAAR